MRFNIVLQLLCTFAIDRIRLIVESTIGEYSENIINKLLFTNILVAGEFYLYGLQINRIFDDSIIIRYNFFRNRLSKWP